MDECQQGRYRVVQAKDLEHGRGRGGGAGRGGMESVMGHGANGSCNNSTWDG